MIISVDDEVIFRPNCHLGHAINKEEFPDAFFLISKQEYDLNVNSQHSILWSNLELLSPNITILVARRHSSEGFSGISGSYLGVS